MLDFWSWVQRRRGAKLQAGALVLDSLSDDRLGDLLGALLYTSFRWRTLRRCAVAGRAEPDFVGEEDRSPESSRVWWVKVARPGWGGDLRLPTLVGELASRHRSAPDALLIASTSDVGQDEATACMDIAKRIGIPNTLVWSRADLDSRLKRNRPDLVLAYFGGASSRATRSSAHAVRRRLEIKHRVLEALLMQPDERPVAVHPFDKFRYSHVIVRSISDESYPDGVAKLGEAAGWYRLATYDALHDGLELLVGRDVVVRDGAGNWRRASARERHDQPRHRLVRALRIGKLPYERIVEFDVVGDEYYPLPHLYCDFSGSGSPFAEVRFQPVDRTWQERMAAGQR